MRSKPSRKASPAEPSPLPPRWLDRMQALLGADFPEFATSYEHPAWSALRVNTLKLSPERFRALAAWPLEPLPWATAGFLLGDEGRPGAHPYHAAGLYYLQEPSAMAVVAALDVRPGQLVLDLAASPGGKATQIASALASRGVLVANEILPARIKPLGENLERWGVRNALLLNDDPARLAPRLVARFDRVLLDAPCSGEGMFRKTPAARSEWSPEHVAGSAARQKRILEDAARMVKPGGLLVYSTCTFAPEENERVIAAFLDACPAWTIDPLVHSGGPTAADAATPFGSDTGIALGRPDWTLPPTNPSLANAARMWPHRLQGEGHFIARLRAPADRGVQWRDDFAEAAPSPERSRRSGGRDSPVPVTSDLDHIAAWHAFAAETLATPWPSDRLQVQSGLLYLAPEHDLPIEGIRVVRPGLCLGSAKPGRFEPSHALALALAADDVPNRLDLDPEGAARYLAGAQFDAPGPGGWLLVTVDGFPLGWARRSGLAIKNHYPKGLRRG